MTFQTIHELLLEERDARVCTHELLLEERAIRICIEEMLEVERDARTALQEVLIQTADEERTSRAQFHDVFEELAGYVQILS